MPANYLALYRGESPESARLVAVSSEPEIVELFIRALVGETGDAGEHTETTESEPLWLVPGGDER